MSIDVQFILEQKVKALPLGDHTIGLQAVRSHIDAAERHLRRGQQEEDETFFTDVIFRCNQAFEGSIKEAFRVLAGQDPKKKTPSEIEQFLSNGSILKKNVLTQFTRYRQEWRNPSTHDYTLNFDEDEALLAIVTVCVFSIVLCDQIASRLAFLATSTAPVAISKAINKQDSLIELVASSVCSFASSGIISNSPHTIFWLHQVEGALAGYLYSELKNDVRIKISQDVPIDGDEVDILVQRSDEKIIIEIKSTPIDFFEDVQLSTLFKISRSVAELEATGAIVFEYASNATEYTITTPLGAVPSYDMRMISPSRALSPNG